MFPVFANVRYIFAVFGNQRDVSNEKHWLGNTFAKRFVDFLFFNVLTNFIRFDFNIIIDTVISADIKLVIYSFKPFPEAFKILFSNRNSNRTGMAAKPTEELI